MRRLLTGLAFVSASFPAWAALPVGSKAPDFTTVGALAGKPVKVHLGQKLKHGPVVLYFFPKAFTGGCDLEARLFGEKAAEFQALGASIVGMSADDLDQLKKFSVQKCSGKFPVATANPRLRKAYDVVLAKNPDYANRTSYVIAPDGRIVMEFTDMTNPAGHVEKTLAAVRALKGK